VAELAEVSESELESRVVVIVRYELSGSLCRPREDNRINPSISSYLKEVVDDGEIFFVGGRARSERTFDLERAESWIQLQLKVEISKIG
jgi:hypothetical protein